MSSYPREDLRQDLGVNYRFGNLMPSPHKTGKTTGPTMSVTFKRSLAAWRQTHGFVILNIIDPKG